MSRRDRPKFHDHLDILSAAARMLIGLTDLLGCNRAVPVSAALFV